MVADGNLLLVRMDVDINRASSEAIKGKHHSAPRLKKTYASHSIL